MEVVNKMAINFYAVYLISITVTLAFEFKM